MGAQLLGLAPSVNQQRSDNGHAQTHQYVHYVCRVSSGCSDLPQFRVSQNTPVDQYFGEQKAPFQTAKAEYENANHRDCCIQCVQYDVRR